MSMNRMKRAFVWIETDDGVTVGQWNYLPAAKALTDLMRGKLAHEGSWLRCGFVMQVDCSPVETRTVA